MSFKLRSSLSLKSIFIVGAMFLLIGKTYAQKPEAEIDKFVRDFAKAYENITKTRDKESVLKYFSKDMFSTIVKSNVVDNFGLIQSSYSDFESYLDQLLRTDGMNIKYQVNDILRSKVRGKTGVVVCDISVQVSSKGEVWSKGTEITTFTLKKFKDGWKILYFNVISLDEEQNKGTCLVQIYTSNNNNYVAKTIVPDGSSYQTNLNTFEFNKGSGLIYINLDNESTYSWMREGPVTKLAEGNTPEKSLGPAVDEYEAVLTIIKDVYSDHCTDFRRK